MGTCPLPRRLAKSVAGLATFYVRPLRKGHRPRPDGPAGDRLGDPRAQQLVNRQALAPHHQVEVTNLAIAVEQVGPADQAGLLEPPARQPHDPDR